MTKPSYDPKFPFIGLQGKCDSKLEAKASFAFANLNIERCTSFDPPLNLSFGKGENTETYMCKPDFYHPKLDLYIELKGHTLNSRKTPSNSKKALARQAASRGFVSDWDKLQHGFNHSKYKHIAIQRELTPERYIIVFDGPISANDMETYSKIGLVCIPLLALPSYLGHLHFRRRGLNFGFSLGYTENYREHKSQHTWLAGSKL